MASQQNKLHLSLPELSKLSIRFDEFDSEKVGFLPDVEKFIACLDFLSHPHPTSLPSPAPEVVVPPKNTIPTSDWQFLQQFSRTHLFPYLSSHGKQGVTKMRFVWFLNETLKGTSVERAKVCFDVIDLENKGIISREDLRSFFERIFLNPDNPSSVKGCERILGFNENVLTQVDENIDYLVLALKAENGDREEVTNNFFLWRNELIRKRIDLIVNESPSEMNFAQFLEWTNAGHGSNSMLWLESIQKLERILFEEEGDVLHQRFFCRGCRQTPIRGVRWRCKDCKHFDLCQMCWEEKRAVGQGHEATHEWDKFETALVVHWGFGCDGCDQTPVIGVRWRCTQCLDFDLCENCKEKGVKGDGIHESTHEMEKIALPLVS